MGSHDPPPIAVNFYHVLEVAQDVEQTEITKAYRDQARRWHPDKQHPEDRSVCTERFQQINDANEVLSDPYVRPLYDEWLRVSCHHSTTGTFEGDFGLFREYVLETKNWTGSSYADCILKGEGGLVTHGPFSPSGDDLKLVGVVALGCCVGTLALWKVVQRSRWLHQVPWLLAWEWALDTLPEAWGLAERDLYTAFSMAPVWSKVLHASRAALRRKLQENSGGGGGSSSSAAPD